MNPKFETISTMSGQVHFIDNNQVTEEVYNQAVEKENALDNALAEEAEVFRTQPVSEGEAEFAVDQLMRFIGADMEDPNCIDTPKRTVKAWRDYWGVGYKQNSQDFLTVFPNEGYDELIAVENIPIHSTCSHHLAAITGYACIAIIPDKELIGLSKYARVADMFARRLQLQERLTVQIADEIEELLSPIGVAVYIRAAHGCMSSRGVKIHDSATTTIALRGAFKHKPETRAEFMAIALKTKDV